MRLLTQKGVAKWLYVGLRIAQICASIVGYFTIKRTNECTDGSAETMAFFIGIGHLMVLLAEIWILLKLYNDRPTNTPYLGNVDCCEEIMKYLFGFICLLFSAIIWFFTVVVMIMEWDCLLEHNLPLFVGGWICISIPIIVLNLAYCNPATWNNWHRQYRKYLVDQKAEAERQKRIKNRPHAAPISMVLKQIHQERDVMMFPEEGTETLDGINVVSEMDYEEYLANQLKLQQQREQQDAAEKETAEKEAVEKETAEKKVAEAKSASLPSTKAVAKATAKPAGKGVATAKVPPPRSQPKILVMKTKKRKMVRA